MIVALLWFVCSSAAVLVTLVGIAVAQEWGRKR